MRDRVGTALEPLPILGKLDASLSSESVEDTINPSINRLMEHANGRHERPDSKRREARVHFCELLRRRSIRKTVIVELVGRQLAAVIPIEEYHRRCRMPLPAEWRDDRRKAHQELIQPLWRANPFDSRLGCCWKRLPCNSKRRHIVRHNLPGHSGRFGDCRCGSIDIPVPQVGLPNS